MPDAAEKKPDAPKQAAAAPTGGAPVSADELAYLEDELASLHNENDVLRYNEAEDTQAENSIPIADSAFVPGFGKYIIPYDASLTNQYQLIFDRQNELSFDPEAFEAFDGVVARVFLSPAISHPNHPDYFSFEPLRDNIATVRNFAMVEILKQTDLNDPAAVNAAMQKCNEMGREIGVALQRDTITRRPGSLHLDVTKSSVPGAGAAEIYKLLQRKQHRSPLLRPLDWVLKRDYRQWNLPPIEDTPFSSANVQSFCIPADGPQAPACAAPAPDISPEPVVPAAAPATEAQTAPEPAVAPAPAAPSVSSGQQLAALGASIMGNARSLDKVEKLPRPVKDRAIELARDILDKLRLGLGEGGSIASWLSLPGNDAVAYTEGVSQLTELYAQSYETATAYSPQLASSPFLVGANAALGKLSYLAKAHAYTQLEGEGLLDDAAMLRAELETYPAEWTNLEGDTVESLLSQIQSGLEITHKAALDGEMQALQQTNPSLSVKSKAAELGALLQKGVSAEELKKLQLLGTEFGNIPAEQVHQQQRQERTAQRRPVSRAPAGATPDYRQSVAGEPVAATASRSRQ